MVTVNSVVVVGTVQSAPSVGATPSGALRVGWTVLVDTWGSSSKLWIPCASYGKPAEGLADRLVAGAQVAVTGRLSSHKDSKGTWGLEVVASQVST